jgi:hypothetical protein
LEDHQVATPEKDLLTVNPLAEPAASARQVVTLQIVVAHQDSQIANQAEQALLVKANKA